MAFVIASLDIFPLNASLAGRQPPELTLRKLVTKRLPLDWSEQETALGFVTS